MSAITEQDVAAHHLWWAGHLPDWVPANNGATRRCSICGVMAGSVKAWYASPQWNKR
jgi:hypothetical protein